MEKYKCIIIDDDRYAIDSLAAYINAMPNLELVKSYESPVKALVDFQDIPPVDLILLDIHMPQMTGIQLSKSIRSKTQKLIFTTSYTQYGYEAFEVEADGYLLKPFTLQKFMATVTKTLADLKFLPPAGPEMEEYFFVKNKHEQHRLVKVWHRDIVAVESQQNYVLLHTVQKKVLTYMSLREIARTLTKYPDFVQFQRSFIIAKSHIESITGNSVRMDNGLEFTVGDVYRNSFQQFIQNKLLKTCQNPS